MAPAASNFKGILMSFVSFEEVNLSHLNFSKRTILDMTPHHRPLSKGWLLKFEVLQAHCKHSPG